MYGGPLEVLEATTPVMAIVTFITSIFWELIHTKLSESIYFDSVQHTILTVLIISGIAAVGFLMVWVEYCVILNTSALTLMVAG